MIGVQPRAIVCDEGDSVTFGFTRVPIDAGNELNSTLKTHKYGIILHLCILGDRTTLDAKAYSYVSTVY